MQALIHAIDRWTTLSGTLIAWLSLVMMLVTCTVVILRYGFDSGFIALQESISYLHGALFMLGAAFTLQQDAHVRVDIFYRNFSARTKAWIDSLGCILFLLPLCVFTFAISWEFFLQSWQIREVSAEPGGIPAVFALKFLIPLMALGLFLQGVASLFKNLLILMQTQHEHQF
jgi:TRAP-type mannitol/chloroaromatic compound transport system permease small subunit